MPGKKKEEKKKCSYKHKYKGYKCSREALPGDEHCIFHSKDIDGKKKKFNDAFWKEFERQKMDEREYDFSGFVFPDYISFREMVFEKDVCFIGAEFFERVAMWRAQFLGTVNFWKVQFSDETEFLNVQFVGLAIFSDTKFSRSVSFIRGPILWSGLL